MLKTAERRVHKPKNLPDERKFKMKKWEITSCPFNNSRGIQSQRTSQVQMKQNTRWPERAQRMRSTKTNHLSKKVHGFSYPGQSYNTRRGKSVTENDALSTRQSGPTTKDETSPTLLNKPSS